MVGLALLRTVPRHRRCNLFHPLRDIECSNYLPSNRKLSTQALQGDDLSMNNNEKNTGILSKSKAPTAALADSLSTNNSSSITNSVRHPLKWSFYKRVLPPNLTALNSIEGKTLFREAMSQGMMEPYFPLSEQFLTQSDPAFCGVATLAMVLNSLEIDPTVRRWSTSGWRWFDEDVLLGPGSQCCINRDYVRSYGITLDQFLQMGKCFGADVKLFRPPFRVTSEGTNCSDPNCIDSFRTDVLKYSQKGKSLLVTSFCRSDLKQTGDDGHFSPIAGYHQPSDQVLILDVARFKYSPYWVPIKDLYLAMSSVDETTRRPRGWLIIKKSARRIGQSNFLNREGKRPVEIVASHDDDAESCPIGVIKKEFCPAAGVCKKIREGFV